MCGIAGIVHMRPRGPVPEDLLARMVSAIGHRGPDESGLYLDDRVGLGHARLSIIDLAGGSQPIGNEDETLWIVYNGEIFNYVELREDLVTKGHRFRTATDTEAILHLYEEKGPDCLQELNGQFAFAIWDSARGELFLARDRLGIRPLHYTVQDGRLLFASEIKSLFVHPDVPRRIDPGGLDQVFSYWTTLPGRTVFQGVVELPPGHYLLASERSVTVTRYWDIPFAPRQEQLDWPPARIAESVLEILTDAIRLRLRADVPVGCYVSGGLDSSGIAALTRGHFDNRLRTFGIRFEEGAFDEGEFQQQMVASLGTEHREVRATNESIGAAFPEVVWHCEKPLLRTAPVPLYLLSEAVRRNGFKVVLTGEGADEIFGGYNIYREALVRRFWSRSPSSELRPKLIGRLYPYIFRDPRLRPTLQSFFGSGIEKGGDPFFSHRIRWENTARIKTFFSDEVREATKGGRWEEELEGMLPSAFGTWDPLARAQYLEMAVFLSNYLLSSQGDRVAMANAVEIRLPFLDYRLVEFMGRVPSRWKILGLREKHILKKALKGVVPEAIRARPKHPYRAPIRESLLNGRAEWVGEVTSDESLGEAGLFDPKKVRLLVKKLRSSPHPGEVDGMALAGILSAQLVHREFVSRFHERSLPSLRPAVIIDRRSQAVRQGGSR